MALIGTLTIASVVDSSGIGKGTQKMSQALGKFGTSGTAQAKAGLNQVDLGLNRLKVGFAGLSEATGVTAGMQKVGAALGSIAQKAAPVANAVSSVGKAVGSSFALVGQKVSSGLAPVVSTAGSAAKAVGSSFALVGQKASAGISPVVKMFAALPAKIGGSAIGQSFKLIGEGMGFIKRGMGDIGGGLSKIAGPRVGAAIEAVGAAMRRLGSASSAVGRVMGPVLGKAAGAIGAAFQGLRSAAGIAATGIGVFAGAGLAAGAAFTGFGIESARSIDQLADAAGRIGTTTEALGGLQYAARLTGSDAESMRSALQKMNATLGDATTDISGPAASAFERLGLDARALSAMDPSQAFQRIVQRLAAIPDQAQRAAAAQDLLGRGALNLMGTINSGPQELQRLMAEFKGLGGEVSALDAAKVGSMWDAFDRLGVAVGGAGQKIAVALAPFLTVAADKAAKFVSEFATADNVKAAIERIGKGVATVADAIQGGVTAFKRMQIAATETAASILKNMATLSPVAAAAFKALTGADAGAIGKGMDADVSRMKKDLENFRRGPTWGERVKTQFDNIAAGAANVANSFDKTKTSTQNVGDAISATTNKIADLEKKFREEIATMGMTSQAAEIHKLKMNGATDEQLKGLQRLADQQRALQRAEKTRDRMREFGVGLDLSKPNTAEFEKSYEALASFAQSKVKDMMTPLQSFADESVKIQLARQQGLLTAGEADLAMNRAGKGYLGSLNTGSAAAVEAGSTAAYSALVAHANKSDAKSQIDWLKKQTEYLRQLAEAAVKGERARPERGPDVMLF